MRTAIRPLADEEYEVEKLAGQAGVSLTSSDRKELGALFKAGAQAKTQTERRAAEDALMDRLTPGWRETDKKVKDDFTKVFDLRHAAYKGGAPISEMEDSGYTLVTCFAKTQDIWNHLLQSAPGHLTTLDRLRYRFFKKLPRWAVPTEKGKKAGVPVSGKWPKGTAAGAFGADKKPAG